MALQPEHQSRYSRYHQQLIAALERCGFEPEEEVAFGPYSVDAYVRELHVAFEADGPHHTRKRDEERDDYLRRWCKLPVIRLHMGAHGLSDRQVEQTVRNAASTWAGTAERRYHSGLAEFGG